MPGNADDIQMEAGLIQAGTIVTASNLALCRQGGIRIRCQARCCGDTPVTHIAAVRPNDRNSSRSSSSSSSTAHVSNSDASTKAGSGTWSTVETVQETVEQTLEMMATRRAVGRIAEQVLRSRTG